MEQEQEPEPDTIFMARGRHLHQCYLWDCERTPQPFCLPAHQEQAVQGDLNTHRALVLVDGLRDVELRRLVDKCLNAKRFNMACGVPVLPVESVRGPPWLNPSFRYNMFAQERERAFIFASDVVADTRNSVWRNYTDEPTPVQGTNMLQWRWYLRDAKVVTGRFRMTRFTTFGVVHALYWLNYKAHEPGKSPTAKPKQGGRVGGRGTDKPQQKQNQALGIKKNNKPLKSPLVSEQCMEAMLGRMLAEVDLQNRIDAAYDSTIPQHQEALKDLWTLAFPEEQEEELHGIVSAQWKEMGWQGKKDPSTDFRGGGFISLENLLYFARNFPKSFLDLLRKQFRDRSEWEYPFAVAGINKTFMLIQMLDLEAAGSAAWLGRGLSCVCAQGRDGDACPSFDLTPAQEECLQRLQNRIDVAYDSPIQEALKDLWKLAFPEEELFINNRF